MTGGLIRSADRIEDILKKIGDDHNTAEPSVDVTLLKLNVLIQRALQDYFPQTKQIDFRFDLPEKTPEETGTGRATVSIFLYDIQEDLQMRSGESRRYNPATGKQAPGLVHVRCCYLLTYWPGSEDPGYEKPDNEPAWVMNRVLNALLNRRTFTELPGSYTQVIPPSEHLNSLGTFWQALGNKPRLCLSYSVTVPMQLQPANEKEVPPIRTVITKLDGQAAGDALEQASADLWQNLCNMLCEQASPTSRETILRELGRVVLRCVPIKPEQVEPQAINHSYLLLMVSGVTTKEHKTALIQALLVPPVVVEAAGPQEVNSSWSKTYSIGGVQMAVEKADFDKLIAVPEL